jgi:hypothetical protein
VARKDVSKLLESELSPADFDALRSELASDGFLAKGKRNTFTLTEAGRERALRFLGVTELPDTNWSTVIARYLLPEAAGLPSDAAARLDNGDKLAAFILKRKYELPADAGSTVKQVLEALVCRQLGFSNETTLDGLLCAVLNQLMESQGLSKQQIAKQLPLFETGMAAASADAARRKIVRDWLRSAPAREPRVPAAEAEPLDRPASDTPSLAHSAAEGHLPGHSAGLAPSLPALASPSPAPVEVEPFDPTAFAATVRALAAKSPAEDRFHDNKVFIAALWRAAQREPSFPRLSLPQFKERLVEANSQGLLHLSRADFVQAMDPQMVADSETEYLNAAFHFVLLEGDHP